MNNLQNCNSLPDVGINEKSALGCVAAANQYENKCWRKVPGGVMRPGGIELTARLIEWVDLASGSRILDIGCGRGTAVAWLGKQGFDSYGIDISQALVAEGVEQNAGLKLSVANAAKLPWDNGDFDAVLLECSLSVMDIGRVLAECHRVTMPTGLLLISDIYSPSGNPSDMSGESWRMRIKAAGFDCLYFEDHTQELRDFAAQILWDTGSLDGLRDCLGCSAPANPGYFSLAARKKGGE